MQPGCVGINSGEETNGYLEFDGTMCTMGKLQDSFKEKFGFNIAMLVGSDFLIRQNARIDRKKNNVTMPLCSRLPLKQA